MSVRILIDRRDTEPFADAIQWAADSERTSFGFLPPNAYREFTQQGRAVVAVSETTGELVGYCLFGGAFPQAKIFQTYVSRQARGHSVGQKLLTAVFDRLESLSFLSIIANVASDLPAANRFYEKMGFDIIATKQGGKTSNRLINVRAKELGTPSLLDFLDQRQDDVLTPVIRPPRAHSVPRYVVDLNVIFDVTKQRPRSEVALGVITASLENDVKLAITEELLNELEKHSPPDRPDPVLEICRGTPTLKLPNATRLAALRLELLPLVFPEKAHLPVLKANDESDLRHLATAIEEGATGFITSDDAILRAADGIQARFQLSVLSPSAFGQGFEAEFGAQPQAFVSTATSTLQASPFADDDRDQVDVLLSSLHVSDALARRVLAGGTASAPRRREVVRSSDSVVAFASWDAPRPSTVERELYVFANEAHPDARLAIRHLLMRACGDGGNVPVSLFSLKPKLHQRMLKRVAVEHNFYADGSDAPRNPVLRKIALARAIQTEDWQKTAAEIKRATGIRLDGLPSAADDSALSLVDADGNQRIISLIAVEEMFGPTIIGTHDRSGVILPIRPSYVEALFHGGQQPNFLDHREAALKSRKAYIGGNYGSIPEGGLAFFYESGGEGGRKAVIAVARIVARYALPPAEAAAISSDRGVIPEKAIRNDGRRPLKTVIDVDTLMLFKHPITKDRLCQLGCWDGANLVTAKVIAPNEVAALLKEGMPRIG